MIEPYVFKIIFSFITDVIDRNLYIPIINEIIELSKTWGKKLRFILDFVLKIVIYIILSLQLYKSFI